MLEYVFIYIHIYICILTRSPYTPCSIYVRGTLICRCGNFGVKQAHNFPMVLEFRVYGRGHPEDSFAQALPVGKRRGGQANSAPCVRESELQVTCSLCSLHTLVVGMLQSSQHIIYKISPVSKSLLSRLQTSKPWPSSRYTTWFYSCCFSIGIALRASGFKA